MRSAFSFSENLADVVRADACLLDDTEKERPLEVVRVVWNRNDALAHGVTHDDVAASLSPDYKSEPLQGSDQFLWFELWKAVGHTSGSKRDEYGGSDMFFRLMRNLFTVFLKHRKISLNRVLDIFFGFLKRFTLRHASGKRGYDGNIPSFGGFLKENRVGHDFLGVHMWDKGINSVGFWDGIRSLNGSTGRR